MTDGGLVHGHGVQKGGRIRLEWEKEKGAGREGRRIVTDGGSEDGHGLRKGGRISAGEAEGGGHTAERTADRYRRRVCGIVFAGRGGWLCQIGSGRERAAGTAGAWMMVKEVMIIWHGRG